MILQDGVLLTDDRRFYIQVLSEDEFVYVPREHPLMKLSDEQFAELIDDKNAQLMALALCGIAVEQ